MNLKEICWKITWKKKQKEIVSRWFEGIALASLLGFFAGFFKDEPYPWFVFVMLAISCLVSGYGALVVYENYENSKE